MNGGIAYQIYPKSFMDLNGDGIGYLRGIINKEEGFSNEEAISVILTTDNIYLINIIQYRLNKP